jgi:hypothetical protein
MSQLGKLAHSTTLTPLRRATKVLKFQKFYVLIQNGKMTSWLPFNALKSSFFNMFASLFPNSKTAFEF